MTENTGKRRPSFRSRNDKTKKADDSKLSMVPILSRRSIIILGSGFVIGLLLALGYWLVSPLFTSTQGGVQTQEEGENLGLLGILGVDPGGPYQSSVNIQIVNPGTTYMSLGQLQQFGEYYAAKANSLPFLEFLEKELTKYPLETEYTIDDLDRIIGIEYNYGNEFPSIRAIVTTDTEDEAIFFTSLIPRAFPEYLVDEEKARQEKLYQDTEEEIKNVEEALLEAKKDLAEMTSNDILDNNPQYIALSAQVEALQQAYNNELSLIAIEYYEDGSIEEEYNNTLLEIEAVVAKLVEAQQEMQMVSGQEDGNTEDIINRLILESTIAGLKNQLNVLIVGGENTTGLSQLIASGITAGANYENLMNKIEMVAEELAVAQQEYDDLVTTQDPAVMNVEYQVAMIKVETYTAELNALQQKLADLYSQMISMENGESNHSDFDRISTALNEVKQELESLEIQLGYDRISVEAEINNAQDRVNTLSGRLNDLNGQLAVLISDIENAESLETGYLVAGNPSNPVSVLPERAQARNTLIMGAILGVVVAWLILNFRWIIRSLSSKSSTADEGDMED